jgi:hypothetical protein
VTCVIDLVEGWPVAVIVEVRALVGGMNEPRHLPRHACTGKAWSRGSTQRTVCASRLLVRGLPAVCVLAARLALPRAPKTCPSRAAHHA